MSQWGGADLQAFLHALEYADSLERSAYILMVKFEVQILPKNPALYGIWGRWGGADLQAFLHALEYADSLERSAHGLARHPYVVDDRFHLGFRVLGWKV
jgi:hypothetical protein